MFNYSQRRYLGNKFRLNSFIQKSIEEFGIKYKSFADIFAGTGSVGFNQLELGKEVILNDILYSNYVMYEAFAGKGKYSFNYVEKYGWPKIIHQFTLKILFLIKNLLKVTLFSLKIL